MFKNVQTVYLSYECQDGANKYPAEEGDLVLACENKYIIVSS